MSGSPIAATALTLVKAGEEAAAIGAEHFTEIQGFTMLTGSRFDPLLFRGGLMITGVATLTERSNACSRAIGCGMGPHMRDGSQGNRPGKKYISATPTMRIVGYTSSSNDARKRMLQAGAEAAFDKQDFKGLLAYVATVF